ncbi:hypothetical protein [Pseudaestuariivita sp.]|uniref:hypothetical protein n=1 Tax=Pseudaestuariivita sp. TaxID=2211669 RepID=UPI00405A172A
MKGALLTILALCLALPAHAVTLQECARTTHISHGGEDMHRDLGEGRVMWRDWWSQEGTASDFTVADCGSGHALRFRTAEERMNDRLPFDKTDKALKVIASHEEGARAFATFNRMAADLDKVARDIAITELKGETCACAALYPELRGDKAPFVLG